MVEKKAPEKSGDGSWIEKGKHSKTVLLVIVFVVVVAIAMLSQ